MRGGGRVPGAGLCGPGCSRGGVLCLLSRCRRWCPVGRGLVSLARVRFVGLPLRPSSPFPLLSLVPGAALLLAVLGGRTRLPCWGLCRLRALVPRLSSLWAPLPALASLGAPLLSLLPLLVALLVGLAVSPGWRAVGFPFRWCLGWPGVPWRSFGRWLAPAAWSLRSVLCRLGLSALGLGLRVAPAPGAPLALLRWPVCRSSCCGPGLLLLGWPGCLALLAPGLRSAPGAAVRFSPGRWFRGEGCRGGGARCCPSLFFAPGFLPIGLIIV